MLLLMTVEPGFGGQPFLDVVLPKIRRARGLLRDADSASGCRSTAGSTRRPSSAAPRPAPTCSSPARPSTARADPAAQRSRRLRARRPRRRRDVMPGPGRRRRRRHRPFVELNLRLEGFEVAVAHDGEQALDGRSRCGARPGAARRDAAAASTGSRSAAGCGHRDRTARLPVIMLTAQGAVRRPGPRPDRRCGRLRGQAVRHRSSWSPGCARRCGATRRCAPSPR